MLRVLVFGWLFVVVIVAAWAGALAPRAGGAGRPTRAEVGVEATTIQTLDRVERRSRAGPRPGSGGGCAPFLGAGPTFGPNQIELDEAGQERIRSVLEALRAQPCVTDPVGRLCSGPETEIGVEGHTDDAPSTRPGGNAQLSFDRAGTVSDWLKGQGVIVRSVTAFGASQPLLVPPPDERSAATRQSDNRRVELRAWCPREH